MIKAWTTPVILVVAAGLAGCDENGEFSLASPGASEESAAGATTAAVAGGGEVIERDVESPEVFEAAEAGLWDGRPSLGGVWVAHPDVSEPERVLIRNAATGSEVIGALFRRERDNPGPRIQVSSDAAAELGMLAGQPVELAVVALRREVIEVAPPAAAPVAAAAEGLDAGEISTASLDPIAAAAAAIDEAEAGAVTAVAASAPASAASPAPAASAAPAPGIDRAYVQIGIFSVEANANNTAASLRNVGIVPTVLRQESRGKEFWRVIVGPATSTQERGTLLRQVKDLGFSDAYFVSS